MSVKGDRRFQTCYIRYSSAAAAEISTSAEGRTERPQCFDVLKCLYATRRSRLTGGKRRLHWAKRHSLLFVYKLVVKRRRMIDSSHRSIVHGAGRGAVVENLLGERRFSERLLPSSKKGSRIHVEVKRRLAGTAASTSVSLTCSSIVQRGLGLSSIGSTSALVVL